MISKLSPECVREGIASAGKLIDVRSAAEYAVGHIPGAINVPMEQVEARTADIGDGPVILICEAGVRAATVAGWLEERQPVSVLAGGTAAWRDAGFPVISCAPCRWTLERQVRLAAGIIVLAAALLSIFADLRWAYLAMFMGAGLTFAGATNFCGMAVLLARMPWNRKVKAGPGIVTSIRAQCRS